MASSYSRQPSWLCNIKIVLGSLYLKELHPCSIWRVSNKLRDLNEEAYEPKSISIGLLHKGATSDSQVQLMAEVKWSYMYHFLCHSSKGVRALETKVEECGKELEKIVDDIRASYDGNGSILVSELSKEDIERKMILDGCFLLEFLMRLDNPKIDPTDPIFESKEKLYSAVNDITLLENQIPFIVLKKLYIVAIGILDNGNQINLGQDQRVAGIVQKAFGYTPKNVSGSAHILDLMHFSTVERGAQRSGIKPAKQELVRCATKLHAAGVIIRPKACPQPPELPKKKSNCPQPPEVPKKKSNCPQPPEVPKKKSNCWNCNTCFNRNQQKENQKESDDHQSQKKSGSGTQQDLSKIEEKNGDSQGGTQKESDENLEKRDDHQSQKESGNGSGTQQDLPKIEGKNGDSQGGTQKESDENLEKRDDHQSQKESGNGSKTKPNLTEIEEESGNGSVPRQDLTEIEEESGDQQQPPNLRDTFDFDISFDKTSGVLEIPVLYVKETTEVRLMNLIALEQSRVNLSCKYTSYALFFRGLICCKQDIELLKKRGIIVVTRCNKSDGDLQKLFRTISKGAENMDSCYSRTCKELNKYRRNKCTVVCQCGEILWHQCDRFLEWVWYNLREGYKNFKREVLSSRWKVTGIVTAAALLTLTILQTKYASADNNDKPS